MLNIHIQPIQNTDLPTLHALSVQTFKETFEGQNTKENLEAYLKEQLSLAQIKREVSDTNTAFYFAYCKEELVGYLKLNFKEAQKEAVLNGKAFEIQRIYILQEYQGKGLGTQLFNKALQLGKAKGHQLMWLGVWEFNFKALEFYQKKGLKAFGSHVFQLGNDSQTDILMQLKF
mgnify:FL=1